MANKFHRTLTNEDNHATNAKTYADTSARDADVDWHSDSENINKQVRIDTPLGYFYLASNTPTWVEVGSGIVGPQDLAVTLSVGNITGGFDLLVSAGDTLQVADAMTVGGLSAPNAFASLDLIGTDKALILNRLTTTQRDALTAIQGMTIFNITTGRIETFDGLSWEFAPGIDDVLSVGQVIDGNSRMIELNNGSNLSIDNFDLLPSTFTTRASLMVGVDSSILEVVTGNGLGAILATSNLVISDIEMKVKDEINSKGLEYEQDYSANFTPQSLIDKNYSDFKSVLAQNVQNTGLIQGAITTQASGTTVDITSGMGYITDYSDPANPVTMKIDYAGETGYSVLNLATDGLIRLGFDVNGDTVEFVDTALSNQDIRDNVIFGSYAVQGGVIILAGSAVKNLGYDGIESAKDFIRDVIGPANIQGNIISPNGANLSLDGSGGPVYLIASNFRNDPEIPDESLVPSGTAITFFRVLRQTPLTGAIQTDGGPTTFVNPNSYDLNGVLTVVGNNNWTVQVVSVGAGGNYLVAFGQEEFNTLALAQEALLNGTLNYDEATAISSTQVRRSFMIVKQGSTDLSDPTQAVFFEDGKFRTGSLSTSGGTPGVNSPGGSNTNIQFNDNGVFGGSNNLTWNGSLLNVTGNLDISGLINSLDMGLLGNTLFLNTDGPGSAVLSTIIGFGAGAALTTASGVSLVGEDAGKLITSGSNNTALGLDALGGITTGINNTGIGWEALELLSAAHFGNTALGSQAAAFLVNGDNGVYIGSGVVNSLVNGDGNIVIGANVNVPSASTSDFLNIGNLIFGDLSSGFLRIGGTVSTVAGPEILRVAGDQHIEGDLSFAEGKLGTNANNNFFFNTVGESGSGLNNTFIGHEAGTDNVSGNDNTGVGHMALHAVALESNNAAFGFNALTLIGGGVSDDNAGFGGNCAPNLATGTNGVYFGANTALTLTSGGNNIIIGQGADVPAPTTNNFLNIGDAIFGDLANGRIRIGGAVALVAGPEKLRVEGDVVVTGNAMFEDGILGTVAAESTYFFTTSAPPDFGVQFSTMMGSMAGDDVSTADNLSLFGREAGSLITTGAGNSAFGTIALRDLVSGIDNSAFGFAALVQLSAANGGNCGFGRNAAMNMLTGNDGVYMGREVAPTLVNGSRNIIIGESGDVPAATTDDFLSFNNSFFGDLSSNQFVIGGTFGAISGDASLELGADDKAILVNRLSNINQTALAKVDGMIWYNFETDKYMGYENGVQVTFTTS